MLRNVSFPVLPGFNFRDKIRGSRFHKSQIFEYSNDVPIITEKMKTFVGGNPLPDCEPTIYPSVYTRSAVNRFPAWVVFDKQVLCFEAYFQSTVHEMKDCAYQIRKCKIFFHLEDGTIMVVEPKQRNSGIPQGTLMHRQRIRIPAPRNDIFYDIIDFNIGKEVELYGRVFKIINCDHYTRVFLNRLGISVPDPIPCPEDPYMQVREKEKNQQLAKKPAYTQHTLSKFLAHDRQVLRFWGYWDDRHSPDGLLHRLRIQFYLSDDTVDIKEETSESSGLEMGPIFLKRSKLPKEFTTIGLPGDDFGNPLIVLNVLGESIRKGHYIYDSMASGRDKGSEQAYITDKDLGIGKVLDVYGRKVVLTSCDPYTEEYYRSKYGLDDFTPAQDPSLTEAEECKKEFTPASERELPPYNGYGTHEDSAQNCRSFILVAPKPDFAKFLEKDRKGLESFTLRFEARMISSMPSNADRRFLINFYLSDDTIAIFERVSANSGYFGGKFLARQKVIKPGETLYSSKPPQCYLAKDFCIGGVVIINDFHFLITNADEYALSYMENNCNQFPQSNVRLIMDKVRTALQPIYKDFIGKYICIDPDQTGVISYHVFWRTIKEVLGEQITDHEILTLARAFPGRVECRENLSLDHLRPIVHTEIRRNIYHGLERLGEHLKSRDRCKQGWLPRKEIWACLRASKLPVQQEILEVVVDKLDRHPSDDCLYSYHQLMKFLDAKNSPPPTVVPLSPEDIRKIAHGRGACKIRTRDAVNYLELMKGLNLEEELLRQNK
ncbi:EF-hand domain-containing family member C2-like [Ischnura elegans]|uniref:EF-hand domain-containing family member C2-like n=1 Tax=Ischnura elegans TaxID=197161 RepID=UPI001ED8BD20|nr:EF-hand domain-containing family member C2-like [Ischnura elegans]